MGKDFFCEIGAQPIPEASDTYALSYYYICNRDGSLRWIWPRSVHKPLFLKFYSATNLRAKLYSYAVWLIFLFRLQLVVFRSGKIHLANTMIGNLDLAREDWAAFAGTIGENRKVVFYSELGYFLKLAVSESSRALVRTEARILQEISSWRNPIFIVPKVIYSDENMLCLGELSGQRINSFDLEHQVALLSLYRKTTSWFSVQDVLIRHEVKGKIERLKNGGKIPPGIVRKLMDLYDRCASVDGEIACSLGHFDFTPWNTLNTSAGLAIYDWELARNMIPLGYDALHHIMQTEVMVNHNSWSVIAGRYRQEVKPWMIRALKMNEEQFDLHAVLYILIQASYYLDLYREQEIWHPQIYWQINTWNQAISGFLNDSPRISLIEDVFDFLHGKDYATIKLSEENPKMLDQTSDIDMFISGPAASSLESFIRQHHFVTRVGREKKSYMTRLKVILKDKSLLSLDLLRALKIKSTYVKPAEYFIRGSEWTRYGTRNVSTSDEALYVSAFYHLNGVTIPEKYCEITEELNTSEALKGSNLVRALSDNDPRTSLVKREISEYKTNKFPHNIKHKIWYILDSLRDILGHRGIVITFSGIDGAGKSTMIERLVHLIDKKFRENTVVLRHRPSILPILSVWTKGKEKAHNDVINSLPRQGENVSRLSSLLRFGYYYLDYLVGQWIVYFKYLLRGYTVIYDRYYFDFINDGRRSNINLPKSITKFGYKFIKKPDYNFFLYADAKVILQRKQELDRQTIERLTEDYKRLFADLAESRKQRYVSIENINLDKSLEKIEREIYNDLST